MIATFIWEFGAMHHKETEKRSSVCACYRLLGTGAFSAQAPLLFSIRHSLKKQHKLLKIEASFATYTTQN